MVDATETFHEYALEWTETRMTWKINDTPFHTIERLNEDSAGWPFDESFHLILNLAVGGNWGGKYGVDSSGFPQQFVIDYVRVYQ